MYPHLDPSDWGGEGGGMFWPLIILFLLIMALGWLLQ